MHYAGDTEKSHRHGQVGELVVPSLPPPSLLPPSFFLIYMYESSTGMFVYHVLVWYPSMPEGGIGSPGTGVAGSCELPCG